MLKNNIKLLFAAFLSLSIALSISPPQTARALYGAKEIVPSTRSEAEEAKFVLMIKTSASICTGSILTQHFAITAGHCIHAKHGDALNDVTVSLGTNKYQNRKTYRVERVYKSNYVDVALLRLRGDGFTESLPQFPKAPLTTDPNLYVARTYGWGVGTRDLLKFSRVDVHYIRGPKVTHRHMQDDACTWDGDSGGPTYKNGVLVSILSTSPAECQNTHNTYDSSMLWPIRTWIQQTISENAPHFLNPLSVEIDGLKSNYSSIDDINLRDLGLVIVSGRGEPERYFSGYSLEKNHGVTLRKTKLSNGSVSLEFIKSGHVFFATKGDLRSIPSKSQTTKSQTPQASKPSVSTPSPARTRRPRAVPESAPSVGSAGSAGSANNTPSTSTPAASTPAASTPAASTPAASPAATTKPKAPVPKPASKAPQTPVTPDPKPSVSATPSVAVPSAPSPADKAGAKPANPTTAPKPPTPSPSVSPGAAPSVSPSVTANQPVPALSPNKISAAPTRVPELPKPAAPSDPAVPTPSAPLKPTVLAGEDRYVTNAKVASNAFSSADTIFLASGEDFADALSAGPAAIVSNAPLLLSAKNFLPESIISAIKSLNPKKAVIVGGVNAIGENVENTIKSLGLDVRRIAGKNRFLTNKLIIDEFFPKANAAFVASAYSYADSLSASSVASLQSLPVVLVSGKYSIDAKFQQVTLVGGEKVLSSPSNANALQVERIFGQNRLETSALLLKKASFNSLAAVNAYSFADALSAVNLAKLGAATVLTSSDLGANAGLRASFIVGNAGQVQ